MESQQLLRHVAFSQLNTAIDIMDQEDKLEYLIALQVAPHLVLAESDPMLFIRYSNYDTQAAAQLLVLYWKKRREIFGDRSYLPITITGTGALVADDIDFLQTGLLTLLPHDRNQRPILCYDSSRSLQHGLTACQRTTFYFAQILLEDERVLTNGLVVIVLVSDPKIDSSIRSCIHLLQAVFPVRILALHFVNCVPRWMPPGTCSDYVRAFLAESGTTGPNLLVHSNSTEDELAESLAPHGLVLNDLPKCARGSWSYERFWEWCNVRRSLDQERFHQHLLPDKPAASVAALVSSATFSINTTESLSDSDNDRKLPAVQKKSQSDIRGSILSIIDELESRQIASPDPSKTSSEDTDFMRNCCRNLDRSFSLLPIPETSYFREALQSAAPETWEFECNPLTFLRFEHFNHWLAARRMARYWHMRLATFHTSAYQTLSQTGEGALRRIDYTTLQTGFVSLLPHDDDQCPVMWLNTERLPRRNTTESRDKVLFYMLSLLSENVESQTKGAVLLYKLEAEGIDRSGIDFLSRAVDCFPIRFKAIHVLADDGMARNININTRVDFCNKVYFHGESRKDVLCKTLEAFGLSRRSLPRALSGEWGVEKFVQWQEIRTRLEFKIPLGLSWNHLRDEFPSIRPHGLLPESESAERKRRMNVIHCRRKRNRQLIDTEALQEKCESLADLKGALQRENERLEELLASATAMITKQM